jgi:hypothetical protein
MLWLVPLLDVLHLSLQQFLLFTCSVLSLEQEVHLRPQLHVKICLILEFKLNLFGLLLNLRELLLQFRVLFFLFHV